MFIIVFHQELIDRRFFIVTVFIDFVIEANIWMPRLGANGLLPYLKNPYQTKIANADHAIIVYIYPFQFVGFLANPR